MSNTTAVAFYDENAEEAARRFAGFDRVQSHVQLLPSIEKACQKAAQENRIPRILSIGEGTGLDAKLFAERYGAEVLAVDASEGLLTIARRDNAHPNVTYLQDSWPSLSATFARRTTEGNIGYDVVFSNAALQEVAPQDQKRAVQNALALVQPGGVAIFKYQRYPTRDFHHEIPQEQMTEWLDSLNVGMPEPQHLKHVHTHIIDHTGRPALNGQVATFDTFIVHIPEGRQVASDQPTIKAGPRQHFLIKSHALRRSATRHLGEDKPHIGRD